MKLIFCIAAWLCFPLSLLAQQDVPEVTISATRAGLQGLQDAASSGMVGAARLEQSPVQKPADLLEFIPGLVVTQHSGDGKANQYFLRGFNLDHGTDFATSVGGVPLNLPSHAHGQGYSDLNFLIPELVQQVQYRKGPYTASLGDFSSAGAADFVLKTKLEKPFMQLTWGAYGYQRGLAAGSIETPSGKTVMAAFESQRQNGPWRVPEGLHKTNALLTVSEGTAARGWQTRLSSYQSHWTATDQVPQRLMDAGSYAGQPFGRFDSLDPTDGGTSSRHSLSGQWHDRDSSTARRINWYAVQSQLGLFSNFTYNTKGAAGDQFAQQERRQTLGGAASQAWMLDLSNGRLLVHTLGLQWRQDRIGLGLYKSQQQRITATTRTDNILQTMAGLYGQSDITWSHWLRTTAGLRLDNYQAAVNGQAFQTHKVSPKLSLIFSPTAHTDIFANAGRGFHSNDARTMAAAQSADAGLVASKGQEIGLTSRITEGLQMSLVLWRLDFDSELVYQGDTGTTLAGRASRRSGLEWTTEWAALRWLTLDASLGITKPRYADGNPLGSSIPNTTARIAHLSWSLKNVGAWTGSLSARYKGSTVLNTDASVSAPSSTTLNLRIANQVNKQLTLAIDVFNLTNRQYNDISYWYASQLRGEAAPVNDLHVHPAQSRTVRVTGKMSF